MYQTALAKAKEQVHNEPAEECDNGYPWDTFIVGDDKNERLAVDEPVDETAIEHERLKVDAAELLKALNWIRTEATPPVHGSMADMPTINAIWEVADKALAQHERKGGVSKRESVSLAKCSEVVKRFFELTLVEPHTSFKPMDLAKAVLDTAGVGYVD
jgi:hypothetical protein